MNDNEKNVVTLKLRFHKDRDEEYSVYRFLKSSGQSVTKTVISCVDVYQNIQSESADPADEIAQHHTIYSGACSA